MSEQPIVTSAHTSASPTDYNQFYYQHCCGMPYARTDAWLNNFGAIADHIVRDIAPRSVLDAGCAFGFLVESLRDRAVEAYGLDISEYAIQQAREDIKPFCRVGSVLEPLPRTYDLIVCIEVLEHLTPQQCDQAIGYFCQASDDILFSSTPDDYHEATHINVNPPGYWAGLFARHGFYRDVGFDSSFITAWAMRFRRSKEPVYRLVGAYEQRLWQLSRECAGAHSYAIEVRNQLADTQAQLSKAQGALRELETIQLSPGWRFVLWVGRVRLHLFPPGSQRERWWLSMVNRISSWIK